MEKRMILVISLISLFALCLVNFQHVKSQVYTDLITISPDGSIDPPTAPIQHNGDVYTLTGDTSGFVVIARNNTIFDGAKHAVQGISGPPAGNATYYNASQVSQCVNLTIVNAVIEKGWIAFLQLSNSTVANNTIVNGRGISWSGSGNTVSGNTITNNNATSSAIGFGGANNTIIGNNITGTNSAGISLGGTGNILIGNYICGTNSSAFDLGMASYKNIIVGNQVANNSVGVHTLSVASTYSSQGNVIYYNNFIYNTKNVDNAVIMTSEVSVSIWDNGTLGNYWSNYNGSDANGDGIGDIPYTIDTSNVDHFPLLTPVNITADTTAFLPSPTPSPSPSPSPSPTPSPTQTPYLTPTPSPSPISSPSLTSSPSPSIPEFPAFTAIPLLLAASLGVLLFHKKLFKAKA